MSQAITRGWTIRMIYTITLNPALDHFLDVDDLRLDDANRVKGECLYAGGKGIDVSRAIRQDRKSTRLNSSHSQQSRMPSSA